MRVLWVVNTIFPDLALALDSKIPVVGGWMYGLAKDLAARDISLSVATTDNKNIPINKKIKGISYYLLKGEKFKTEYDTSLEEQWKTVVDEVQPDIVHIHGTEYAPGLALFNACPELNYVASIQGLISVYERYYTGGISIKEILSNITFRDLIKNKDILSAKKKFKVRGKKIEIPYFKKIKYIIGRTDWDWAHAKTLNNQNIYYFCNESLRDSFYSSKKWNYNTKNEFTIFLSQASYPIKGLHKVLEAINLIKNDFPMIKVRVAGGNIIKSSSFSDKLRLSGYGKYIRSLISKFKLERHLEFTGPLDEMDMIEEYLNCHVFICPSSIENSPNSVGEAQLLGTPCIASYVGGVPNMLNHGVTGLAYRFEEVEQLAQAIKSIFMDSALAETLSKNGIAVATQRHDRKINLNTLMGIYKNIIMTGEKSEFQND